MRSVHLADARHARAWSVAAITAGAFVMLAASIAVAATPPANSSPRAAKPAAEEAEHPAGKSRATAGRTLDSITIEGEIAVPQVLFITSREQPRYRDLLHRRFLRTSVDVGEQVGLPSRVVIKESRP